LKKEEKKEEEEKKGKKDNSIDTKSDESLHTTGFDSELE
jgi:hypothetical protein